MSTLQEAIRSGELDDYSAGAPSREVALEDKSILAGVQCPCGQSGVSYRPFHRPGSYRAWAVCPQCQKSSEF